MRTGLQRKLYQALKGIADPDTSVSSHSESGTQYVVMVDGVSYRVIAERLDEARRPK